MSEGLLFLKCTPDAVKQAEAEGPDTAVTLGSKLDFLYPQQNESAGLDGYPSKFWDEVAKVLFSKDDTQAAVPYNLPFFLTSENRYF